MGSTEGGDGCSTAETDEVTEIGVRAEAGFFSYVAGGSRAQVAGAGAEEEGIDFPGADCGFFDCFLESLVGKGRVCRFEGVVELLSVLLEGILEVCLTELTLLDAGIPAEQDFF